jgi:hypothetical protein
MTKTTFIPPITDLLVSCHHRSPVRADLPPDLHGTGGDEAEKKGKKEAIRKSQTGLLTLASTLPKDRPAFYDYYDSQQIHKRSPRLGNIHLLGELLVICGL